MAGIEITGVSGFGADIDALIARVNEATRSGVAAGAAVIEAAAKARVPVKRGTLRRSINMVSLTGSGGVYTARVAPTTVYGRRIELGFVGTDSIGRVYSANNPFNAHGKPYLRPAVDASGQAIQQVIQDWWASALAAS